MLRTPLALSALLLSASLGLGCGQDPSGGGSGKRISRQDLADSVHTVTQYWLYSYDAAGVPTEVRGYNGAGALQTTSVYTTTAGRRTLSTALDAAGAVTGWTTYEYTAGVLSRATSYTSGGAVNFYSTYVFDQGRKLTTSRYSAADVYLGRTEFDYDAVTGKRTGSTSYDASDLITGVSTRTYVGNLLHEAEIGGGSSFRTFTYEDGTGAIDPEQFFEF